MTAPGSGLGLTNCAGLPHSFSMTANTRTLAAFSARWFTGTMMPVGAVACCRMHA